MATTVTVPTVVVVLPILAVVAVAWWLLISAFMDWIEPKFFRWYWHHIGGEGEPPSREETDSWRT